MWQEIVVGLIVLSALGLAVRSILRMSKRGGSCCAECDRLCPSAGEEKECSGSNPKAEGGCHCDGSEK